MRSREPKVERKRVVLFTHRMAEAALTGVGRYSVELTRALVDADPEKHLLLTVTSLADGGSPASWVPPQASARYIPGPRKLLSLSWAAFRHPRVERLIGSFDLLHILTPSAWVPTNGPVVVTVHDLLPIHHPEWYALRDRLLFRRTMQAIADRGAVVITPSRVVADDVAETLGIHTSRIRVVPEGVAPRFDAAEAAAGHSDELLARFNLVKAPYVVALGAITPRKNLSILFHSLESVPDLRLVLVGPLGFDHHRVLQELEQSEARDRIIMTGFLPDVDVAMLLQCALALVHPSSYEGFGLTPIEAMACGTPVVCSDAGSIPEVVGDAALLVAAHDASAWRVTLSKISVDQRLRNELSARGLRHAEGFSWQLAAQRTLQIYQELGA